MSTRYDFFDTVPVARDLYKSKFEEISKKHKETVKHIREDLNPRSEYFKKRLDQEEESFASEIEKLKVETSKAVNAALEKAREKELSRLNAVPVSLQFDQLKLLSELKLSGIEYNKIVDNFGNKNYWTDRMLVKIGEESGIENTRLEPAVDTRIRVIDEIQERWNSFLNEYSGFENLTTKQLSLLSDGNLMRLEKIATNGFLNSEYTPEQLAQRMLTKVKSEKTALDKTTVFANQYNQLDQLGRSWVIYKILSDPSIVNGCDEILSRVGLAEEAEKFRKENYTDFKAAADAIETIKSNPGNKEGLETAMLGNEYFRMMSEAQEAS